MQNEASEEDAMAVYQHNSDGFDKKIDLLYLKGIIADKMLVYEDSNLRIGCIRSISFEWRQATLKLYIGNKSQTEEIQGIVFSKEQSVVSIRDEEKQPYSVDPNDQLEVIVYISSLVQNQPFVYFKYG